MDSVRAANTTVHGYTRDTTPFINEFAESATVFTQARSPSGFSVPSHLSIFHGSYELAHAASERSTSTKDTNIWEHLRDDRGYETGIFTNNPFFYDNTYGLLDGFDARKTDNKSIHPPLFPDSFDPRGSEGIRPAIKSCLKSDHPGRAIANGIWAKTIVDQSEAGRHRSGTGLTTVIPHSIRPKNRYSADVFVDEFLEWLPEQKPWAACLNLMDAHEPCYPREEYDKWSDTTTWKWQKEWGDDNFSKEHFDETPWWKLAAQEALYDGAIRQIDAECKRLIRELEEKDELSRTYVVITSDHGQAFGEKSELDSNTRQVGHWLQGGLSEVRTHIPLITKEPGQETGKRTSTLTSLVQFPDSVRRVLDEHDSGFESTDCAFVTAKRQDDRGMALYEEISDGMLLKYSKWKNHSATLLINSNDEYCRISPSDNNQINEFLQKQGWEDAEEEIDVDSLRSETHERLQDLGYLT